MEFKSRFNLKYAEISVFFLFEKKPLENLPQNWHNLDLTKYGRDEFAKEKNGSCG